jgi:hypothetical protein
MESADELATDLLRESSSDASRIERAYAQVMSRPPTVAETNRALRFIDELAAEGRINSAEVDPMAVHRAWSLFCQSLFASNEFMYVR